MISLKEKKIKWLSNLANLNKQLVPNPGFGFSPWSIFISMVVSTIVLFVFFSGGHLVISLVKPHQVVWWSPCKLDVLVFFFLENGVLESKQSKSQAIKPGRYKVRLGDSYCILWHFGYISSYIQLKRKILFWNFALFKFSFGGLQFGGSFLIFNWRHHRDEFFLLFLSDVVLCLFFHTCH